MPVFYRARRTHMSYHDRSPGIKYGENIIRDWAPDHQGRVPSYEAAALEAAGQAVRYIGPIYAMQIQGLYDAELTDAQIQEAACRNPDVFDPYTVVVRDPVTGAVKTQPYHEYFEEPLRRVANKLREAASTTKNRDFRTYLNLRAESLTDGDYEKSEAAWLGMDEEPLVDVVIGPYDRYLDKAYKKKYGYQGWTDVLNHEKTEENMARVKRHLDVWRRIAPSYARPDPIVRLRVGETELAAGQAADPSIRMTANNLPCQIEWRNQYGSKIVILNPALQSAFWGTVLPMLHQVVDERILERYSQYDFEDAAYGRLTGHEVNHATLRRESDEERLGNLFPKVNEMGATVFGLAQLGDMNASRKEMETIFAMNCAAAAADFESFRTSGGRADYTPGHVAIINYLLKKRCLDITEGGKFRWDDITEIVKHLGELSASIEYLVHEGDSEDALRIVFDRRLTSDRAMRLLVPFRPPRRNGNSTPDSTESTAA